MQFRCIRWVTTCRYHLLDDKQQGHDLLADRQLWGPWNTSKTRSGPRETPVLQNFVAAGVYQLWSDQTVYSCSSCNPADIGTKRLPCARLRSLMCLLGMYNLKTAEVEGANDPGGIMTKKAGQHVGHAERLELVSEGL